MAHDDMAAADWDPVVMMAHDDMAAADCDPVVWGTRAHRVSCCTKNGS